jgi:hypothetical protein
LEDSLTLLLSDLNTRKRGRGRRNTEIVRSGDLRFVAAILTLEEALDEGRVDVAEKVFDGLILDLRVLDSDRSLEDTNSLRILVKDSVYIPCCP